MAKEKKTEFIDPEQERWYRTYPKFPGVTVCVELMHRNNLGGTWREQVDYELRTHASETVDELIAAFQSEQEGWVRMRLLSIIARAAIPAFEPLLIENLQAQDNDLRKWAKVGLEKLDTKTARTALWEAKQNQDTHEQFVQSFLTRYPCVQSVYAEHRARYGELLIYVFFADLMRFFTKAVGEAILSGCTDGLACAKAVLQAFETIIEQPDHPLQNAVLVGFTEAFYNSCLSASEPLGQRVTPDDIARGMLEITPALLGRELNGDLPETLQAPTRAKRKARRKGTN